MILHARLQHGSRSVDHDVEVKAAESAAGPRRFRIGSRAIEAHCEIIAPGEYLFLIEGRSYGASVSKRVGDPAGPGGPYVINVGTREYRVELRDPRQWRQRGSAHEAEGPQEITAPMPGRIVKVLVTEGQEVKRDEGLLVIEAMKMQNELRAPRAGRVERVYLPEGRGVESGARLVLLI